jgi:hypothetical protein
MNAGLKRKRLPDQVAEELERAIRAGKWVGRLPGNRLLADLYGVDRKTCAAAAVLLEKRGLLGPARPGQHRDIIEGGAGVHFNAGLQARHLLILSSSESPLSHGDERMLSQVRQIWESSLGSVSSVRVGFERMRRPGALLDELIQRHNAHALVLFIPTLDWSREAANRLPSYQFGGDYPAGTDPNLSAYAIDHEIAAAADYLRSRGHRRILIPIPTASSRFRENVLSGLGAGERKTPDVHEMEECCPVFPEAVPTAWRNYWSRAMAKVTPTAVVVFEDHQLLSLYGTCRGSGLRIPDDLSVVMIGHEELLEWCQPRPTMMKFPTRRAIAHFKKWLAGGLRPVGRKFLPLEIIEGESVAAPPR